MSRLCPACVQLGSLAFFTEQPVASLGFIPHEASALLRPANRTRRAEMVVSGIGRVLTWLGGLTTHPLAVFTVVVYGVLWFVVEPDTLDWHGFAMLATWMMTVFIQRVQHRDTQAIHAKLDHLLERIDRADPSLAKLDQLQPEEIERFREKTRGAT